MGKQGVIPSLCRNCKVRKPHVALIEAFEQGRESYDLTPYHNLCLNIFSGGFLYPKLKNTSSYGLLIAGLSIITLLTALSGMWHYDQEVAAQITKKSTPAQVAISKISGDQASAPSNPASGNSSMSSPTNKATPQAGVSASQTHGAQAQSYSNIELSKVRVSLSVNGYSKGVVSLSAGSNQCDILAKALADHLISSLDMRYSSQYKTQGVYVIDGIGDPASVWWTYKLNGSAPPFGCAGTAAHDGDSVNWQYVKK